MPPQHGMRLTVTTFDLDGDVTTTFSDEFWKCHESVTSALTHVNLQSWNINTRSLCMSVYVIFMQMLSRRPIDHLEQWLLHIIASNTVFLLC